MILKKEYQIWSNGSNYKSEQNLKQNETQPIYNFS